MEHIVQDFDIEANTPEEAMKIAAQKYYDCELILDNAEVTEKFITADDGENYTDWKEF